jgi:hypothetical protein
MNASDLGQTKGVAAASSIALPTGEAIWPADANVTMGRLQILVQARRMRERLQRIGCADALSDFDSKPPWLVAEMEAFGARNVVAPARFE